MKLSELLTEKDIKIDLKSKDKDGVLDELVSLLVLNQNIQDCKEKLLETVTAREKLMSTGIGEGIGIPHAKTDVLNKISAVFGKSKQGVAFDALDNEPVYLFFLLVAPQDQSGPHVKALARISRLLKHSGFREKLKASSTPKEVISIIREEEEKHF